MTKKLSVGKKKIQSLTPALNVHCVPSIFMYHQDITVTKFSQGNPARQKAFQMPLF